MTPLSGRIYPKGVSEAAGVLHKSRCSAQALSLWPLSHLSLWPLSHLSLFFITVPWSSGFEAFPQSRPLHGLSYPWVSGGNTVAALVLCPFPLAKPFLAAPSLGDAYSLGDASSLGDALLSWRRPFSWRHLFFLATPFPLGDASC